MPKTPSVYMRLPYLTHCRQKISLKFWIVALDSCSNDALLGIIFMWRLPQNIGKFGFITEFTVPYLVQFYYIYLVQTIVLSRFRALFVYAKFQLFIIDGV